MEELYHLNKHFAIAISEEHCEPSSQTIHGLITDMTKRVFSEKLQSERRIPSRMKRSVYPMRRSFSSYPNEDYNRRK